MIKLIVFDVDGTLTDGKIYMSDQGELFKAFDIKDGYALSITLPEKGIIPVVLTSRESAMVKNRCRELGITHCCQNVRDKSLKIRELAREFGLRLDEQGIYPEIAYMGDDLIDLPAMRLCGLAGCPADAAKEVKYAADYISIKKAGEGAAREFIDWIISIKSETNVKKRIDNAIRYIQSISKDELLPGKYVVNNTFYYMVQEYETKQIDECRLESHRNYIDIQLLIEGTERIEIADVSRLQVKEDYSESSDVMYWNPAEDMAQIVLQSGSSVVLYPRDAHRGCIAVDEPVHVKKIVGKVKVN